MSVPGRRLTQGGRIDRDRPISFRFNGRAYTGYAGDTLASALLAQGQRLVARSFKYHRPRGIVSDGWEEPNALVRVLAPRLQPLAAATTLELQPGLDCESVNVWPSLRFDAGAVNDRLRRWLPAGFYYKTFMWPARAWPFYERWIRRAAGLGVASQEGRSADKGPYASAPHPNAPPRLRRYEHTDLLVIGAGVAGLEAALTAARAGVRTLLVDDQPEPAAWLSQTARHATVARPPAISGMPADWRERALREFEACPYARRLARTQALGFYDHGFVTALTRHPTGATELLRIRAQHTIIATGASERPMLFPDNDRPGIMLCGAVLEYLERYAVVCGDAILVVCNHDSAYESVRRLVAAGARVSAIADEREQVEETCLAQAREAGVAVHRGYRVEAVRGRHSVRGARLVRADDASTAIELACDLIAMAGGWSPRLHLHSQSGGRIRHDSSRAAFIPGPAAQSSQCAGSAAGELDPERCLGQGRDAGTKAAHQFGGQHGGPPVAPTEPTRPVVAAEASVAAATAMTVAPATAIDTDTVPMSSGTLPGVGTNANASASASASGGRIFVDYANDVTTDDLALARREGYESVELVKRYTTLGMGVDQGKTSNVNGIGVLSTLAATAPHNVGTTTFRPPYTPVEFGAIAGLDPGPFVRPTRTTPMTPWHLQAGAVLYESGSNWRRPGYYPRRGESMAQAVRRECLAVRGRVGIYDSSPLGKIEVRGRGAGAFLDFVYAGRVSDLGLRRGRYGLMLREDGRLFDDGVVFRLGEDRFWVSTTAGNADAVTAWLEYLRQRVWRGAPVYLVPVTAQWSNAVVCGPQARAVLLAAGADIDLDARRFGFMSVRDGQVAGFPARVFRVSFTGELSFEVNVAARHAAVLWQRLLEAGLAQGIEPVGSEANHVLRVEKGYLSIGHEADGAITPGDLGLGWAVAMSKADFVGRRSLVRDHSPSPRRQLVGLLPDDAGRPLAEGAQVCLRSARTSSGFVTASVLSPSLGRSIALALLEDGQSRLGEPVRVTIESSPGQLGMTGATVVKPVFYDPDGLRSRG